MTNTISIKNTIFPVAGIEGFVEKPDANAATSNLSSVGRYVLTPDKFQTLRFLMPQIGLILVGGMQSGQKVSPTRQGM